MLLKNTDSHMITEENKFGELVTKVIEKEIAILKTTERKQ
jgi:hypothetical protein